MWWSKPLFEERGTAFCSFIIEFSFKRVVRKPLEYSWSGGGEFSTRVPSVVKSSDLIITHQPQLFSIFRSKLYSVCKYFTHIVDYNKAFSSSVWFFRIFTAYSFKLLFIGNGFLLSIVLPLYVGVESLL